MKLVVMTKSGNVYYSNLFAFSKNKILIFEGFVKQGD